MGVSGIQIKVRKHVFAFLLMSPALLLQMITQALLPPSSFSRNYEEALMLEIIISLNIVELCVWVIQVGRADMTGGCPAHPFSE
jgi:hypothetical protein